MLNLDLEFQYHIWLRLVLSHNYFADKLSKEFRLKPIPATQETLRRAALLTKPTDSGLQISYDIKRLEPLLLLLENEPSIVFSFWLYSNNPLFLNYTNLPLDGKTFVLYFNNDELPYDRDISFHQEPYVSENNIMTLRSPISLLKIARANTQIEVYNKDQEMVFQDHIEEASPSGEYWLKLPGLANGTYTLVKNGQEYEKFLYLQQPALHRPIAMLDIHITDTIRQELIGHIKTQEIIPTSHYHISFETRYTYWRYYVVPKYDQNLDSFAIETGDAEISFNGPTEGKLPTGDKAFVFESEQALALKEFSPYNFQLIRKKNAKGKDINRILKRLPCASRNTLLPESRDKKAKIYSEIIVYV